MQSGGDFLGRDHVQLGPLAEEIGEERDRIRAHLPLPDRYVAAADHHQVLHQIRVEVLAELKKKILLFLARCLDILASEFGDFFDAETRLFVYFPGSGVMAGG
jgi:hypothetical protein